MIASFDSLGVSKNKRIKKILNTLVFKKTHADTIVILHGHGVTFNDKHRVGERAVGMYILDKEGSSFMQPSYMVTEKLLREHYGKSGKYSAIFLVSCNMDHPENPRLKPAYLRGSGVPVIYQYKGRGGDPNAHETLEIQLPARYVFKEIPRGWGPAES